MTKRDLSCVLLGDPGVGKTCWLRRAIDDTFEFKCTKSMLPTSVTTTAGKIVMCDAPTKNQYADVVFLCFDVSNRASITSLKERWWPVANDSSNTPRVVFLIGCKADLLDRAVISKAEIHEMLRELGLPVIFTSAQTKGSANGFLGIINQAIELAIKHRQNMITPVGVIRMCFKFIKNKCFCK